MRTVSLEGKCERTAADTGGEEAATDDEGGLLKKIYVIICWIDSFSLLPPFGVHASSIEHPASLLKVFTSSQFIRNYMLWTQTSTAAHALNSATLDRIVFFSASSRNDSISCVFLSPGWVTCIHLVSMLRAVKCESPTKFFRQKSTWSRECVSVYSVVCSYATRQCFTPVPFIPPSCRTRNRFSLLFSIYMCSFLSLSFLSVNAIARHRNRRTREGGREECVCVCVWKGIWAKYISRKTYK